MADHPHPDSHMHDFEAHVRAVEEDLEYYRAKRIEPRIFTLLRRGFIEFTDLFNAAAASSSKDGNSDAGNAQEPDLEQRVRALEDGLDDYVREIGLLTSAERDETPASVYLTAAPTPHRPAREDSSP